MVGTRAASSLGLLTFFIAQVGFAAGRAATPTPPPPAPTPAPTSAPVAAPPKPAGPPSAWEIHAGFVSAGPLLFRDTPDRRLEPTTVFEYGGAISAFLGDETSRPIRYGGGASFVSVARSPSRSLQLATPFAAIEIGHPLVLQLTLGPALATGEGAWTKDHSGISTGATLRWSFRKAATPSPIAVSAGLTGRFVASTADFTRSSAFAGFVVDVQYHSFKGGLR